MERNFVDLRNWRQRNYRTHLRLHKIVDFYSLLTNLIEFLGDDPLLNQF